MTDELLAECAKGLDRKETDWEIVMCAAFFGGILDTPPLTRQLQSRSTLLGAILADQKPKSRRDWEARFSHWQKSASDSEEQKIEAAKRRLRRALERSNFLAMHTWTLVPQGSYFNNTNVRNESDVDLAVCLTDSFFYDGPHNDRPTLNEAALEPLAFTFADYKNEIASCLTVEYGWQALDIGKKALHLHKDDQERVSVDAVPCFGYRIYGEFDIWQPRAVKYQGIAFQADGVLVTNFPAQHYVNGCAKNDRTGRRYKRVVRILKRLRNHMAESSDLPASVRNKMSSAASFLIESLVYNCPDACFGQPSIYDDVTSALDYLSKALANTSFGPTLLGFPAWCWWREVNGIKPLFGPTGVDDALNAAQIVGHMKMYMQS